VAYPLPGILPHLLPGVLDERGEYALSGLDIRAAPCRTMGYPSLVFYLALP